MTWMLSCRKVAELLSHELDEPLELLDRLRLRMHLSMCRNCSNVGQQLSDLRALSAKLFSDPLDDADAPFSSPARPPEAPDHQHERGQPDHAQGKREDSSGA